MRCASLLPFAFTAALVAACGSEVPVLEREETAARRPEPARDLTLRAPDLPVVEVASAVELAPPKPAARAERPRPRPKPAPPPPSEPQPAAAPQPISVPAEPVAEPPAEPAPEPEAVSGRELAPGRTVTIIPASHGPLIEADEDDSWLPSERPRGIVGGGGTCRRPNRGVRGIGIAGRIPVGVPTRRLR